ncbi:MAG: DUF2974 domain-containing protein [Clostridia bacterium]|nr:DUF2974 domain-containing protein [Clostridia bacterium]
MALTTEQLCYINNLLYSKSPSICNQGPQTSYEGRTLGEMVSMIDSAANADPTCSSAEWARMKSEIMSDPQLMNLQIVDTKYNAYTGDAHCLLVDPSTNEAVLAFRGTGDREWKDNFIAGSEMDHGGADPTISEQQQVALDYAESFDLSGYDSVTVTGHSKGGNKAKLIALMNDEVDRCVSFDGQGFSDEFMEAHKSEIAANQHKIENHNVDGDFVNILLNDVGETTYYEGQRVDDNFPKNHDPSSFFNNNGEMVVGEQSEGMQELDKFLNSALRSVDGDQKAELLDFAGEIAQAALGKGKSTDKVWALLKDPRYADELSYLLAYTIQYEHETGRITTAVADVLKDMGLDKFNDIIDGVSNILGNEKLNDIIAYAAQYADDIPDWLLDLARNSMNFFGADITDEELRHFLRVIAKTGKYMDDIVIEKNDGADIRIDSKPGVVPPIDPRPGELQDIFDGEEFDSSGLTIFVHFSEMMECCEQLRRAIEYYNEAIEETRRAADELAGNWEGEAKDAFVEDQENALRWYMSLSEVASGVVRALKQNYSRYSDTVDRLADIMRS